MVWCPDRGALAVLTVLVAARVLAAAPAAGAAPARPAAATAAATNAAVRLDDAAWRDLADVWEAGRNKPVGSPVENLTLPLEHHLNGRVRAVLRARTASMADDRLVRAWQVTVDLFTDEGAPDGRIEAESGLFDRGSRRGYCCGAVVFSRQEARVSGTDLFWSAEQQQLRILSHGQVRTRWQVGAIGGWR
jgi:hypothetical protein